VDEVTGRVRRWGHGWGETAGETPAKPERPLPRCRATRSSPQRGVSWPIVTIGEQVAASNSPGCGGRPAQQRTARGRRCSSGSGWSFCRVVVGVDGSAICVDRSQAQPWAAIDPEWQDGSTRTAGGEWCPSGRRWCHCFGRVVVTMPERSRSCCWVKGSAFRIRPGSPRFLSVETVRSPCGRRSISRRRVF
jgi:hypothetical protein